MYYKCGFIKEMQETLVLVVILVLVLVLELVFLL